MQNYVFTTNIESEILKIINEKLAYDSTKYVEYYNILHHNNLWINNFNSLPMLYL
jgi:hypothetical protein